MALKTDVGIYEVARNMGTSVEMIQQSYGKNATPQLMATCSAESSNPSTKCIRARNDPRSVASSAKSSVDLLMGRKVLSNEFAVGEVWR
jgi:hypothetical protein